MVCTHGNKPSLHGQCVRCADERWRAGGERDMEHRRQMNKHIDYNRKFSTKIKLALKLEEPRPKPKK